MSANIFHNGKILGPILKCKCGNIPEVGGDFWYRSKYGSVVIGVIKSVESRAIVSTMGVSYPKDEIETKPLDILRNERLDELGI